ncbi:MAG TPA: hypothetical protein VGH94_15270 [Acidimicrobiales bacterium]|jgi:protocatechuate 3,4-dioxygenase beta subunit
MNPLDRPDPAVVTPGSTGLFGRRKALSLFAGAGLLALAGCASSSRSTSGLASGTSTTTSTTAAGSAAACTTAIPEETAGPYPGDGSNGPNVLSADGIVRRDIRSSFGSATGVADGVPITIKLAVTRADGCTPLAGGAVYAWHCDQQGRYSLYTEGVTGENYLRGIQPIGDDGSDSFLSIFPAAYSGRWPHIHFEVYPSLEQATSGSGKLATSQLALPKAACDLVYATDGYEASVGNLARTSLASDNVFGDGYAQQLATVTGDVTGGMTVSLSLSV